MKLFGYWRSSATYRIRIALALKEIPYTYEPVNLLAGDQGSDAHIARNPQALVPALETDDGTIITQSIAIAEYLEETQPSPPLLPGAPNARARARAIAAAIACEAQPFMNLRVQQYLKRDAAFDDVALQDWLNHWGGGAMQAADSLISDDGPFAMGATPGLADAFIVPQIYAARRFGIDMSQMARLARIEAACADHPAFQAAHPDRQPDARAPE